MPHSPQKSCDQSLHVHVELLLCPTSLQVLDLLALILQSGLSLGLLSLLALEIQLLVELGSISLDIRLGLLEIIFQHATHAVQLQSLVGVHLIL